jgi:hypothetical protein
VIPLDLLKKYNLPENQATDAIESAISRVLSKAFGTDIFVLIQDSLEILSLPNPDSPIHPIDTASIPRQLQRQVRFQIQRELEKRQALREVETLSALRGRPVTGEIRHISSNGETTVALEMEDHFRRLALTGVCPACHLPPSERQTLAVGAMKTFLVTSVLPVMKNGRAKVLIRLSRTTKALPEALLKERTDEPSIRCVRRIVGAFSEIETKRKLPREVIRAVGNELKERIIVRVVEGQNT